MLDQIASKIRASCEQDSIISQADREHTCARDRDLIASKCTYDSEPHCTQPVRAVIGSQISEYPGYSLISDRDSVHDCFFNDLFFF